jgi:putative hydrolase of HD superfamily
MQPLLQNVATGGRSWQWHGIRRDQVVARNDGGGAAAPRLQARIRALIDAAVDQGLLAP